MNLFSKHAAAIHEAAHAVVACKVNLGFSEITLEFSDKLKRWTGRFQPTRIDPSNFLKMHHYLKKTVVVATAGALAQAKFCTEEAESKKLKFSLQNDFDSLISFFKDKSRTEKLPGELSLVFIDSNNQDILVKHTFDGHIYSTQDSRMLNQSISNIQVDLKKTICNVMKLLDENSSWQEICTLAKQLLENNVIRGVEMEGN